MNARSGRPPKLPTGPTATLTLKIPSEVKVLMMEQAEAFDMSLTEYIVTLVGRDTLTDAE
jgi:hypothetical protein